MKTSLLESTESTVELEAFTTTTDISANTFSSSDAGDDDDDDDDDGDDDDESGSGGDNDDDSDDGGGDDGVTDNPDGVIFGTTTVFIEGRSTQVRTESTTLGVLSAQANLFTAKRVDSAVSISITHAGSFTSAIGAVGDDGALLPTQANLEAGKLEGQISQLDIQTALSNNYSLVLLSLSREDILQVIEHGISAAGGDTLSDRFPQLSGLTFSYDINLPPGQRVRSLAVTDDSGNIVDVIVRNGVFQASSSQTTYRIVTTDFLANGGEGYRFPDAVVANRVNLTEVSTEVDLSIENNVATFAEFGSQQDAFAEYLAANFNTVPYRVEETSVEQDVVIQNLSFRSDTVVDIDVNTFKLTGTGKRDRIVAGNLDDILRGFGGKDRLVGRGGDDKMFGGNGNDRISCGFGNDRASGQRGRDIIVGGQGHDRLDGGAGRDRLSGGAGNDYLFGGDGDDVLRAGQGRDRLFGGSGNDLLIANVGASLLDGGTGDDLLIGGRGATTFVIASREVGVKTISNFSVTEGDILRFESYDFNELTITQSGRNTVITSNEATLAVLLNVEATTIETSLVTRSGKSKGSDELEILGFEYEPGTDVLTGQKDKYANAVGVTDDDDLAYIVVSDKKGKLNKTTRKKLEKGRTYFAGEVNVGDNFFADVDTAGKPFKKRTFIHLFEDEQAFLNDENPLQIMSYGTSGKQPIQLGDTIGSAQVTGYATSGEQAFVLPF